MFQMGNLPVDLLDVFAEVAVEQCIASILGVAVHVHQGAESLLRALEEPVDWSLLVCLEMIFVEVRQEILLQRLAQGFLDEAKILVEGGFTEGDAEELPSAGHDLVAKPFTLQYGNDCILIWREGNLIQRLIDLLDVVLHRVSGISEDQSRLIERIAAHHAADGIGEEGGHVAAGLGAGEGDLLLGDAGLQLAVKAVGGDEEPVVLCLQILHPADGGGTLRLPIPPARLQRRALQSRPQQRLVAEVPRGLEVVPVGAGDGNHLLHKRFDHILLQQSSREYLEIPYMKMHRWIQRADNGLSIFAVAER